MSTGRHYSYDWFSGDGSGLIGNQTWTVRDLNGDRKLDLVVLREGTGTYDDVFGTGSNRYWKVYLNTGTGFGTTSTTWMLPAGGYIDAGHNYSFASTSYTGSSLLGNQGWQVLDINGDAKADLVVLTEGTGTYNEPFGSGSTRYWKAYLNSATGLATRAAIGLGNLEVFPNPAQHVFTLRLPALAGERTVNLTLVNSLGQVVQTRSIELTADGTDIQVDVRMLAAGLYTMRVQAGAQAAAQQVVVD